MGDGSGFSMWEMEKRKRKLKGENAPGLNFPAPEDKKPEPQNENTQSIPFENPIPEQQNGSTKSNFAERTPDSIASMPVLNANNNQQMQSLRSRKHLSVVRASTMLAETTKKSEFDLRRFWDAIRRHIYLCFFVVITIFSINTVYVLFQPNIYQSRATLRVWDTLSSTQRQDLSVEKNSVRKASVLEKAIKNIEVWLNYKDTDQNQRKKPVSEDAAVLPEDINKKMSALIKELPAEKFDALKNITASQISGMISVNSPDNNRLLEITAEGDDPGITAIVANAVAYAFREDDTDSQRNRYLTLLKDTADKIGTLAKEEKQTRQELQNLKKQHASAIIELYKANNAISKLDIDENEILQDHQAALKLEEAKRRLNDLKTKLAKSRQHLVKVEIALSNSDYNRTQVNSIKDTWYDRHKLLAQYEADYNKKKTRFSEQNPDLISARNLYRTQWTMVMEEECKEDIYISEQHNNFHHKKQEQDEENIRNLKAETFMLKNSPQKFAEKERQILLLENTKAERLKEIDTDNLKIMKNKELLAMIAKLKEAKPEASDWIARQEEIQKKKAELEQLPPSILDTPLSEQEMANLKTEKRVLEIELMDESQLKPLEQFVYLKQKFEETIAKDSQIIEEQINLDQIGQDKSLLDKDEREYKKKATMPLDAYEIDPPAQKNPAPVAPKRTQNILFGFLVGVIVGVGIALLFEYMDETIRNPGDITREFGIQTLGIIPKWKEKQSPHIAADDAKSIASEVFGVLRNNIRYSSRFMPEKLLMVTSAVKGEGKSYIIQNLALSFALEGNSVALVNADLRKTHNYAAINTAPGIFKGLSDYLENSIPIDEVLSETEVPGLHVITAGRKLEHPSKMLRSSRMLNLLDELEKRYDIVLIDVPAVLPVVDTTIFSNRVRGILVVVSAGETPIKTLKHAIDRLNHVKSPIIGAVLNKATDTNLVSYYGNNYYYYDDTENVRGIRGFIKGISG